jgi:hypothetical protein
MHLRTVIANHKDTFRKAATGNAEAKLAVREKSGFVQSSIMCIDVLARFLGTRLNWSVVLKETLAEVLNLQSELSKVLGIQRSDSNNGNGKEKQPFIEKGVERIECYKTLGSATICVGTLVSVLGAPAVESLSVRMMYFCLFLSFFLLLFYL